MLIAIIALVAAVLSLAFNVVLAVALSRLHSRERAVTAAVEWLKPKRPAPPPPPAPWMDPGIGVRSV